MYPLSQQKAGAEYFIEISMDMTDRKRMEKTLRRSERLAAVGQAVARVAHEIKNPLMIIGGFSLQVRNSLSDDKAIHKLDMTLKEVRRLERLVAHLGDFTREQRLSKRPADINTVVRDVLDMMNGLHTEGKYRFETDLSPNLDAFECDPDKIKQVLINMIVNGIEAMEEGGKVTVCTRRLPNGVEIAIRDHGIGISHDDLDRIFEPFYTTRKRGSGLGLPISFRIVQAHKGEIRAESRPGQGTTFFITLPGPE
jgi:two-component system sensor kinase FixL